MFLKKKKRTMYHKKGLMPAICLCLFLSAVSAAGCGKFKTGTAVSLSVDTGDSIRITIDSDIHKISFDKEKSVVSIAERKEKGEKEEDAAVLMRGIFVPQNSYSLYYKTAYTDSRCSIVESGDGNGIAYTYYTYDSGEKINCEYIGWIKGSNTGVVFESTVMKPEACMELVKTLSFSVDSTNQANEEYVYVPNMKEEQDENAQDKPDEPDSTKGHDKNEQEEQEEQEEQDEPDSIKGQDEKGENAESIDENSSPSYADWTSLRLKIDGEDYAFPYSYKQLQENGWKLYGDISDYISGDDEKFVLGEGEYTYSTTRLMNEKYGDTLGSAEIYVGFKNYGKEDKDILDCSLWAMEVSAVYGTSPVSPAPEVELPGGIKFGASYEDIVSTYGKPDAEEDNGYYLQMDYQHDYSQHMTLYVYNDGLGLLGAELRGH